jgi:hypothetical protein
LYQFISQVPREGLSKALLVTRGMRRPEDVGGVAGEEYAALNELMRELWRWKRKGGDVGYEDFPLHVAGKTKDSSSLFNFTVLAPPCLARLHSVLLPLAHPSIAPAPPLTLLGLLPSSLFSYLINAALHELQGVPLPEDGDISNVPMKDETGERVTSVLLDKLPMSDSDKAELGKGLEGVAIAGVQSFLWSNLVLAALFLVGINFLMMAR